MCQWASSASDFWMTRACLNFCWSLLISCSYQISRQGYDLAHFIDANIIFDWTSKRSLSRSHKFCPGLEKVWELKPLVNGEVIMNVLQLKDGGPLVREWVCWYCIHFFFFYFLLYTFFGCFWTATKKSRLVACISPLLLQRIALTG